MGKERLTRRKAEKTGGGSKGGFRRREERNVQRACGAQGVQWLETESCISPLRAFLYDRRSVLCTSSGLVKGKAGQWHTGLGVKAPANALVLGQEGSLKNEWRRGAD